jgi:arylsulfate sulfotransferase
MRILKIAAIAAWSAFATLLVPVTVRAQSPPCTVSLTPSTPSPHLVGELVVWTATAANCGNAPVFQYKVAIAGENPRFRMVRDFSLDNTFARAPLQEGSYKIIVLVKNSFDATESTSVIAFDPTNSRVAETQAMVTPALNPLVALYSAPACEDGSVHVEFRPVSNSNNLPWMTTNTLPCIHGRSRNFLVAGMLPGTPYEMVHVSSEGYLSPSLSFTTGTLPQSLDFPSFTPLKAPRAGSDLSQSMGLHNFVQRPTANAVNILATDLFGRVEWYLDPLQSGLVNGTPGTLEPGDTMFFLGHDSHRKLGFNVLREIDLAGNPLRETNIDAVNAQLTAKGQEIIYGFHHEILRLPNGSIATLGWTLKTVDLNGVPTPYAGQLLIVLNKDFQVVWTWDAFDHLDYHRGPILGDVCVGAPCPLPGAVDWLHANSIAWSAQDGNLLISLRHQAWEIKIDYQHGSGDGHILWRLGKDGDFAVDSTDPSPWFSYQDNVHYLDKKTLLLFDNGNVRCSGVKPCNSRGQTWTIDEQTMTAKLKLNIDLGNYSDALGSAERLPNGNFVFTSGFLGTSPALTGQSIEVLPDGTEEYVLQGTAHEYRSYRVASLYGGIPK